jgi:predicted PurR-regulated permease PerM
MAGKAAQTIGMLLAPLFWGFVVAYILSPAVDFFENRFQNRGLFKRNLHKRRGIAVAVTYLLAIMFLGALLSIVASALSKSLRIASLEDLVIMIETLAGTLKSFQRSIQDWLVKMNLSSNEVATALSDVGESVARFTSGLSKSVTGTITQIGGLLTSSIFVIIFSIYFLLDKEGIERYWKRVVTAVGGRNARHYCKIIVEDADTVFSGYIRGQLIDALIMAILVSTSLYLIGIKYAVIIGILSGIGNLIPYLGPVVAYGSTILVSLLSGDWKRMIVALVVLFIIQTIDGNVINPKLLSSSIDVHPMLVIAALIIGGALGGFLGMLFAVPVAAFLKVQFDKIIWRLIRIRTPELAIETKPGVTPEKKTDSRAAGGSDAAAAKTGKSGSRTGSSGAGRSGAKASSANHGKSGAKAGTSGAGKSTVRTAAADVEKSSVRAGSLNTGKALATGTVTTAAKTGTAVPVRSGAKAGTAGRTKKSAAGTAGTLKADREKIKKGKRKTDTMKS